MMNLLLSPLSLVSLILIGVLTALTLHDIQEQRLPDKLTLPLLAVGFITSWLFLDRALSSFIGLVSGYVILVSVETFYRQVRQIDGLGRGDAKLLAAGGAWLGWTGLPAVIFIASTSALVFIASRALWKKQNISRKETLPFGPFLALGIATVWVYSVVLPALFPAP